MAATNRVQHFINASLNKGFHTNVLLLYQNANFNNSVNGDYNGTKFKTLVYNSRNSSIKLLFLPITIIRALKYIFSNRSNDNNYIYVYDGISIENLVIILVSRIFGFRIVLDIVEDYSLHEENISFLLRMKLQSIEIFERLSPFLSNRVIVISEYLKLKYLTILKDESRLVHIPISADCSKDIDPNSNKLRSKPIRIVYSGSYGKKDAVDVLINAFLLILQMSIDAELHLLGIGSNTKKILNDQTNERIIYHGYLLKDEYYSFLNSCDILCMTRSGSKYANAGFPFKLGDYLATGKPVIATNVSDIHKYLVDKHDIVLVKPDSVDDFKDALLYLINHELEAGKIGQNGLQKCKMYFNPELNGDAFVSMLESI